MSSAEFAEWQAFNNHDPFGGFRSDLQAAIIARTIAAVFVGKEAPATAEFIPTFWTPAVAEGEDVEEQDDESSDELRTKITGTMVALSVLQSKGSKSVLELKPPTKEA